MTESNQPIDDRSAQIAVSLDAGSAKGIHIRGLRVRLSIPWLVVAVGLSINQCEPPNHESAPGTGIHAPR